MGERDTKTLCVSKSFQKYVPEMTLNEDMSRLCMLAKYLPVNWQGFLTRTTYRGEEATKWCSNFS